MTKLPVWDFHDIWLRSAVYIWYVFVIILYLAKTRTYPSFELNVECFVNLKKKKKLKFYNHFF